jgi:hypothetical protein
MKVKVSEATGHVLDWMVAKSLGRPRAYLDGETFKDLNQRGDSNVNWSEDWAQGGPIIQREKIFLDIGDLGGPNWYEARTAIGNLKRRGPTMLTAAMRCFAANILGEEVEVPEDLI